MNNLYLLWRHSNTTFYTTFNFINVSMSIHKLFNMITTFLSGLVNSLYRTTSNLQDILSWKWRLLSAGGDMTPCNMVELYQN